MFGDLLGRLRSRPDARVRHELKHVVPSCRGTDHLEPGTRQLLRAILDAVRSVVIRGELRQRIEVQTCETLAHMTQERGIRLASMAWDAIEATDLDELAFLIGVLCVGPRDLEIHHCGSCRAREPSTATAVTQLSEFRPDASSPGRYLDKLRFWALRKLTWVGFFPRRIAHRTTVRVALSRIELDCPARRA